MSIDTKTITSWGTNLDYLNHTVKIMRIDLDIKINEVLEKIKDVTHMTIKNKYFDSVSHTINLMRTWENDKITIQYLNAMPLLSISFFYDDIESIEKINSNIIKISLKDNTIIELS